MRLRIAVGGLAAIIFGVSAQAAAPASSAEDAVTRKNAHDIFKQLIEINTTDSVGSTTVAAQAMAQRLLDAGFPKADVVVLGPNDRKGNMVARYRGKPGSKLKPVLIIAHTDVVEAKREDWTTDPFQFVEKDGYFYGRGTQDMKDSVAIAVTDFIRLRKEGFVPDRDIILALTADEENGKSNGVDWLLKNHRELIDAEFALNPDSGGVRPDKPQTVGFEATEKLYGDFQVLATNPGGHSSLPTPDNAIYHVADALAKLQKFAFPFELNAVTREYFTQMAKIETGQRAADLRAILGDAARCEGRRAAVAGHARELGHAHHLRRDHVERRSCAQCPAGPGRSQRELPHLPRPLAGGNSRAAGQAVRRSETHGSLSQRYRRIVGSWLGPQSHGAAAAARRCHEFAAQRRRPSYGRATSCCRLWKPAHPTAFTP